ncbi:MAG: hypothetical protein FWC00_00940 [Firmicutes bacterium]|nr:hypothetical protein [Bacillota bacterium]
MSVGEKEEKEKLVEATIVAVQSSFIENRLFYDEVLVRFKVDETTQLKMFNSPLLEADDIRLWRRIVLTAVTGNETSPIARAVNFFKDYKSTLMGKKVLVSWIDHDVWGIGKTDDKMFYPGQHGLWGDDDEETSLNLSTYANENVTPITDAPETPPVI